MLGCGEISVDGDTFRAEKIGKNGKEEYTLDTVRLQACL
jgi:hypothetical protein